MTPLSIIDEALSANATIANDYEASRGTPPAPRIAIVTCADPRLTDIVRMLGLADGDVFLELLGELRLVVVEKLPPARAHRARIVAVLLVQLFDEGDVGAIALSGHEVPQFSSTMAWESDVSPSHPKPAAKPPSTSDGKCTPK